MHDEVIREKPEILDNFIHYRTRHDPISQNIVNYEQHSGDQVGRYGKVYTLENSKITSAHELSTLIKCVPQILKDQLIGEMHNPKQERLVAMIEDIKTGFSGLLKSLSAQSQPISLNLKEIIAAIPIKIVKEGGLEEFSKQMETLVKELAEHGFNKDFTAKCEDLKAAIYWYKSDLVDDVSGVNTAEREHGYDDNLYDYLIHAINMMIKNITSFFNLLSTKKDEKAMSLEEQTTQQQLTSEDFKQQFNEVISEIKGDGNKADKEIEGDGNKLDINLKG